jgi:hypothetical protein
MFGISGARWHRYHRRCDQCRACGRLCGPRPPVQRIKPVDDPGADLAGPIEYGRPRAERIANPVRRLGATSEPEMKNIASALANRMMRTIQAKIPRRGIARSPFPRLNSQLRNRRILAGQSGYQQTPR